MPISIHLSGAPDTRVLRTISKPFVIPDTDELPPCIWFDALLCTVHVGEKPQREEGGDWHFYLPEMRANGEPYRELDGSLRYTYVSEADAIERVHQQIRDKVAAERSTGRVTKLAKRDIGVARHDGAEMKIGAWSFAVHKRLAAFVPGTPYLDLDAAVSVILSMLATESDDMAEGSDPTGQLYRCVTRTFGEVYFELGDFGTFTALMPSDL